MLRLLKIKDLEARRQALARESEVYRETLKLQFHHFSLYGVRTRQRFAFLGRSNPWLVLLAPVLGAFFRRRRSRSPKLQLVTGLIFAWKMMKRFRSFLPVIFSRRRPRNEEEESAAAI